MEKAATALEIERLERKVDMTLDEIIKMQKKSMRKAKRSTQKPFKKAKKNASQGSVASRSAIRQGKLAQSRPHTSSRFLITKRTGFKSLHSIDTSKMKRRNRRQIRNNSSTFGGATRNIRVLISNDFSRTLSAGRRKAGLAARLIRVAPNELAIDGPASNLQTLDSRFASLRGGRLLQFSGSLGF